MALIDDRSEMALGHGVEREEEGSLVERAPGPDHGPAAGPKHSTDLPGGSRPVRHELEPLLAVHHVEGLRRLDRERRGVTLAPVDAGLSRATANIIGLRSTPTIRPEVRSRASRATIPVPQATSSTDSPIAKPDRSIRTSANGLKSEGTRARSYTAANVGWVPANTGSVMESPVRVMGELIADLRRSPPEHPGGAVPGGSCSGPGISTPFPLTLPGPPVRSILLLLLATACARSGAPSASTDDARIERVLSRLEPSLAIEGEPAVHWTLAERMEHYHVPGVSIAVIDSGRIVWARGFGLREAGGSDSVDTETVFQAGSISKPTFALAVMRLVQDGRLDLDEDVNAKLRSWRVPDNRFTARDQVTLRRILSSNTYASNRT